MQKEQYREMHQQEKLTENRWMLINQQKKDPNALPSIIKLESRANAVAL